MFDLCRKYGFQRPVSRLLARILHGELKTVEQSQEERMKLQVSLALCLLGCLAIAGSAPVATAGILSDTTITSDSSTRPNIPSQERYPRELMQQDTFDVGPGGDLRVDVYDADVEVLTGGGGGTQVDVYLRSNDMEWARGVYAELGMTARAESGAVVVETTNKPSRSWWGSGNRWFSVIVVAQIPEDFNIDIATGDGDVSVDDLRGEVKIHTSDGDISVARLDGPAIMLETSDGDIAATSLTAGDIDIKTSDGDIDIGSLSGPVSARTSDGDIDVVLTGGDEASFSTSDGDVRIEMRQSGALGIRTGDGDIDIVVPESLAADVDLDGEDIELLGGLAIEGRVRDGRAEGRINGGGPLIKAETGDGEIRLVTRN
jgi:hypothetical protein